MSGFIKKMLHYIDAWQSSGYFSELFLGYTRFLKNCCIIDDWQNSKYSSASEHATVLNIAKVTQGFEQNAPL